jgi:hypothetical protein
MGVLIALALGLTFWLVAWAFGAKAFDAFLVTVALVVIAVTIQIAVPFVNRLLGKA